MILRKMTSRVLIKFASVVNNYNIYGGEKSNPVDFSQFLILNFGTRSTIKKEVVISIINNVNKLCKTDLNILPGGKSYFVKVTRQEGYKIREFIDNLNITKCILLDDLDVGIIPLEFAVNNIYCDSEYECQSIMQKFIERYTEIVDFTDDNDIISLRRCDGEHKFNYVYGELAHFNVKTEESYCSIIIDRNKLQEYCEELNKKVSDNIKTNFEKLASEANYHFGEDDKNLEKFKELVKTNTPEEVISNETTRDDG